MIKNKDKTLVPKYTINKSVLKISCLKHLMLLGVLNYVSSLPDFHTGHQIELRKSVRGCHNFVGHSNVNQVPLNKREPFKEYLINDFQNRKNLTDGVVSWIVDTGCDCSCSHDKQDFKEIIKLPKLIILKGVTGDREFTRGGIIRIQFINKNGDVINIETLGHYNPDQTVRLFSPQAHWAYVSKHKGSMLLSWAKTTLDIPGVCHIPCKINDATFMPLLVSFYNVDKVLNHLMSNWCVTDEANPNLTPATKWLLKFHFKLGHLGFVHLKWFLGHFNIFGAKGQLAIMAPVPKCSSCLEGGMKKLPTTGNIHTKDPARKGIVKQDMLNPGDLVLSDQYACSTRGKHFNEKGQLCSTKGYKGGTVFCNTGTGYMTIHHQQMFTLTETLQSMLSFEREAQELGIQVKGYHTDNGVYNSK